MDRFKASFHSLPRPIFKSISGSSLILRYSSSGSQNEAFFNFLPDPCSKAGSPVQFLSSSCTVNVTGYPLVLRLRQCLFQCHRWVINTLRVEFVSEDELTSTGHSNPHRLGTSQILSNRRLWKFLSSYGWSIEKILTPQGLMQNNSANNK